MAGVRSSAAHWKEGGSYYTERPEMLTDGSGRLRSRLRRLFDGESKTPVQGIRVLEFITAARASTDPAAAEQLLDGLPMEARGQAYTAAVVILAASMLIVGVALFFDPR